MDGESLAGWAISAAVLLSRQPAADQGQPQKVTPAE
jgi:hypothetical protein